MFEWTGQTYRELDPAAKASGKTKRRFDPRRLRLTVPFGPNDGASGSTASWCTAQEARILCSHGRITRAAVFRGRARHGGVLFKSNEHSRACRNSGQYPGFEDPLWAAEIGRAKRLVVEKNA